MDKEQAALVKIGSYDHILSLRDEGLLFMNTVPYFRQIEDEELRGDQNDSVDEIYHGHKGHVKINPANGTVSPVIKVTNFELRIGPNEPEKINLFCMYALRPKYTFPIDPKNYRFGSHALAIYDVPEFLRQLSKTLNESNIQAQPDLVEYLDVRHSGKVGIFKKLDAFEYQSEWRLACFNGMGAVRKIIIGPIDDISYLTESSKLNSEVTICP